MSTTTDRTASPGVRQATRADAGALTQLLAEAFFDDALTRWIAPGDARRAELLPGLFRVFLDMALDYGSVTTTTERDAVLLYLPPEGWADVQRRSAEFDARFDAALGEEAAALRTVSALQAAAHPSHPPHYYAMFGAVRPAARRTGRSTALVGEMLRRADDEGRPAYTEASSAGGEGVSRSLGFRPLRRDVVLPDGGPSLRPLWRDPR